MESQSQLANTQNNQNLETIISKEHLEIAAKIDNSVAILLTSGLSGFQLGLAKAKVINQISTALSTEVMKPIMNLQGKKFGFKTDCKGDTKYPESIVKDCLIEAMLRGVEPTGNEFNIIGGNCYITKEGCTRILKRLVKWSRFTASLSLKKGSATLVPYKIQWETKEGVTHEENIEFPVNTFENTKEATMRGAAERDAKQWLIEEITGMPMPIGDAGQGGEIIDVVGEEVGKPKPKPQQQPAQGNANEGIEEATIVNEEVNSKEKIMANEEQQVRFNAYIVKAKDLADLEKKSKEVCKSFKIELDSFNLDKYNELKTSLN